MIQQRRNVRKHWVNSHWMSIMRYANLSKELKSISYVHIDSISWQSQRTSLPQEHRSRWWDTETRGRLVRNFTFYLGSMLRFCRRMPMSDDEITLLDEGPDATIELPPREEQLRLIDLYFTYIHPTLPVLHQECFRKSFDARFVFLLRPTNQDTIW